MPEGGTMHISTGDSVELQAVRGNPHDKQYFNNEIIDITLSCRKTPLNEAMMIQLLEEWADWAHSQPDSLQLLIGLYDRVNQSDTSDPIKAIHRDFIAKIAFAWSDEISPQKIM